jgi:23S rRNA (cytosine1962-C5)-methyltransferase
MSSKSMPPFNDYELLDFGAGRKLERFGDYILDRPSPAAAGQAQARPDLWSEAHARFELDAELRSGPRRGHWTGASLAPWTIHCAGLQFELKLTDFGHVGLFPEQMTCWDWIREQIDPARPLRVLNLFAYTGGSTLAAAAAGAAVTHVDAAKNIVDWARRNAELSSLHDAPIRWIAEDAPKFARREVRRGNSYDAVILDPPAYGHGPAGETWKLDENLPELLSLCREFAQPSLSFLLLTCHAPEYDPPRLAECLVRAGFARRIADIEAGELSLSTSDGRRLPSGTFARLAT